MDSLRRSLTLITVWILYHRSMQEVQLDKHVKLVDSPGIVMDSSSSDSAVILRNCVKVCPYLCRLKSHAVYWGVQMALNFSLIIHFTSIFCPFLVSAALPVCYSRTTLSL